MNGDEPPNNDFSDDLPSLDAHLRVLAIAAQQHPHQSRERQQALARLILCIQRSGRLVRPRPDQFQGVYNDVYAEAQQRLVAHICARIDAYHPERGEVLQWVNFLLKRRFFIEASQEWLPTGFKGVDVRQMNRLSIDDLDRQAPVQNNSAGSSSLLEDVRQVLKDDPEGLFEAAHVANYPKANFRHLARRRLDGYSWQEISNKLDVPVPTLSSFYQRCLTRFASTIRGYLI